MARGQREFVARVHKWRDLWIAVALGCAGTLAAKAPAIAGKPLFGYLSAILFIGASAMAIPAMVDLILRMLRERCAALLGVEAMLAARSLAGSLRRTSVLVGALSTAIAMMTSVGIMVGSFRQTVITWMDSELPADLYLRPAGNPSARPASYDRARSCGPNCAAAWSGSVNRFRAYEIEYQGLPATLAGAEMRHAGRAHLRIFFGPASPADVIKELQASDAALVSEPFAYKHHVKAGDRSPFRWAARLLTFRIDRHLLRLRQRARLSSFSIVPRCSGISPIRRRRILPYT